MLHAVRYCTAAAAVAAVAASPATDRVRANVVVAMLPSVTTPQLTAIDSEVRTGEKGKGGGGGGFGPPRAAGASGRGPPGCQAG
jgi:hypothetical protein